MSPRPSSRLLKQFQERYGPARDLLKAHAGAYCFFLEGKKDPETKKVKKIPVVIASSVGYRKAFRRFSPFGFTLEELSVIVGAAQSGMATDQDLRAAFKVKRIFPNSNILDLAEYVETHAPPEEEKPKRRRRRKK